ncbi:carbamoyltransferase [Streptomyces sp. KCTC 0041BP]|uniref:carbamoyltransferase family protein n=1 Tax=Streptomyces sp. KCTC 0041BP TaxID=201500 RepID=UPI001AE359F6|nr:carbamoyltransferase [Streptomyces sp. KCTC 0041BP]MBP0937551.1 carbamoyltransferase [Streptomyces sp. KCTC 0041BP]
MSTTALGISSYYHDSAAAVVEGGHIVAAAQQERFSRRRHDAGFPALAVASCLAEAGRKLDDVDVIAYYEDPRLKFSRVLATYLATAPRAWSSFRRSMPEWLGWKLRTLGVVHDELARLDLGAVPPIRRFRHHESHAASAFLPSPYESAAVLCVDGVGEWATTTLWHGRDRRVEPLRELRFPHSLGLLYSAFTYFCGFKVDSGEYKLMGLAPYGRPVYAPLIREKLVDIRPDGSFRLDTGYFEFLYGQVMTGRGFAELFGGPRREPEGPLTEREFDLAASVQLVTEEIMLNLAAAARELTGERRLCLAGGVALNCVANGKLVESELFDEIWVQPAAGDAGGALGAALLAANGPRDHLGSGRDGMRGARLGPGYDADRIQVYLDAQGLPYRRLATDELRSTVTGLLAEGKVVGWFQGRMEFGPRALGGRSILGDARNAEMQSTMNLKIKFRESFRPFAPIVLAEHATEYFDLRQDSPYMLIVAQVAEQRRLQQAGTEHLRGLDLLRARRSQIPAVTHVDHSARVQTVAQDTDPDLHGLLTEFHAQTGCPVLVNTSFNVRGEPIVATPEDAYRCFMRTDIDALAIGRFLLLKSDQPPWHEDTDWRGQIPLD